MWKTISSSFLCLIIAVSSTTKQMGIVLDTQDDNDGFGWKVSETEWDDWFWYLDFSNSSTSTDRVEEYLSNIVDLNLDNFKEANGVWIAFNSTFPLPPLPNVPYPTISMFELTTIDWELHVVYYLHNNASIQIQSANSSKTLYMNSAEGQAWQYFSAPMGNWMTMTLITTDPSDVVFIDKVELWNNSTYIPQTTVSLKPTSTTLPMTSSSEAVTTGKTTDNADNETESTSKQTVENHATPTAHNCQTFVVFSFAIFTCFINQG